MTSVELFKRTGWGENEVMSTTQVATLLMWPVRATYDMLSGMAQLGQLDRYGYRIAPGVWASADDKTAPRKNAMHWQRPAAG